MPSLAVDVTLEEEESAESEVTSQPLAGKRHRTSYILQAERNHHLKELYYAVLKKLKLTHAARDTVFVPVSVRFALDGERVGGGPVKHPIGVGARVAGDQTGNT